MTDGTTLKDLLSTFNKEISINNAIIAEAEADAALSGYETRQFYTLAVGADGTPTLQTADETELDASNESYSAANTANRPVRTGYTGYLVGDGFPQNGYDFGHGIQFPEAAGKDNFFLRTDFMPNRLFRYDGTRWIKVEDAVRMTMTNNDTRQTQKTGFINNTQHIYDQAVAIDYVALTVGQTVINTDINFTTALYVVLKLDAFEVAYTVADNAGIITNNGGKVQITLPDAVLYAGSWKLSLCNNREEQRQSLSKVLRPKADL
jgi:hypothetical protein